MWQKLMKRVSVMSCSFLIFMSWVRTGTYWRFLEDFGKGAEWTPVHCLRRFVSEDSLSIFCSQGASYV
jgi:hypothetical protein